MKKMIPYVIFMACVYYILPYFIINTGIGMLILLFVIPWLCFLCAMLYGYKNAFQYIFPIILSILFIPSLFLFYNISAWIYIIVYGTISFAGTYIGSKLSATKWMYAL